MTEPVVSSHLTSDQVPPALIGVGAEAIQNRARHLGLTWILRPATVDNYAASSGAVMATYDGDTVSLGMTALIGPLVAGQRVMGMAIPPGGNYIIGTYGASSMPGTLVDRVSSITATAVFPGEGISLTGNSITWKVNRAYEVEYHQLLNSAVVGGFAQVRIRKGTISGTVIFTDNFPTPVAVATTTQAKGIVRNNTSSDITQNLVLTITSSAGGIQGAGSADAVRWMTVREAGPASSYPNAVSI